MRRPAGLERHALEVDGVALTFGPGHLEPAAAGAAVAAYVAANPGAVAVTVRNYIIRPGERAYPPGGDR